MHLSTNPFFPILHLWTCIKITCEFANYYEVLSNLVTIQPKGKLVELDDTAKANYIKEIENIKSQLPIEYKGEIYRGRIRIQ